MLQEGKSKIPHLAELNKHNALTKGKKKHMSNNEWWQARELGRVIPNGLTYFGRYIYKSDTLELWKLNYFRVSTFNK